MKQETREILPFEPAPGAVPEGISFGDVLRYLPIVLPFIQGLMSGATEIPAFITKTPFGRKRVGPIPISDV